MAELAQIRTIHTGFVGAPGYTNHYFFGDPMSPSTVTSAANAVRSFWEAIAAGFPSVWRYSIDPDVSILDPATGALIRAADGTVAAQGTFGSSGAYAGGVGACVTWGTAAVHRTKRLKGRTFLVPLSGGSYDTDGTIGSATLSVLRSAATTLGAVANFGVWGRPVGGSGGVWSAATSATVRDHVAILKSRRD